MTELGGSSFTEEQRQELRALRQLLTEEELGSPLVDDFFLLRFLDSREMNPTAAAAMLRKHFVWRKLFKADLLHENGPPPKYDCWHESATTHKTDRQGNPVVYWMCGVLFTEVPRLLTPAEWKKIAVYDAESQMRWLQELSHESGKLKEIFVVADVTGVGTTASKSSRVTKPVNKLFDANFPERVRMTVALNVPWLAAMVWNAAKRFFNPQFVAKTELYSDVNYTALEKHIAPENIPKMYGGQCECEGGCLPELQDYLARGLAGKLAPSVGSDESASAAENGRPESKMGMDMEEVTIAAGKHHEAVLHTPELASSSQPPASASDSPSSQSTLASTAAATAPKKRRGLKRLKGLRRVRSTNKSDEVGRDLDEHTVHKLERVPGGSPALGSYRAGEAGYCRFHWDNGFSRLRSKTVRFYVTCGDSSDSSS